MKQFFIIAVFLTFSVQVFSQANSNQPLPNIGSGPWDYGIYGNTSLIQLIATPEKYDGKMIQIIGYLHLEFEGNAIYLHKEDFENSITENGFWVNFSEKVTQRANIMDYSDRYVIIIGTFKMNDKGHLDLFGGTIDDIVRLGSWGDWRKKK
ncbi:hypothetical protein FACS189421_01380 [Bacteroidia bacterium]|nr:hypothetical protein FACS189421_01380 [Bacteroidia bacterium]GHT46066.1 hypothetical protein FACS189440_03290 [Bacteroidia bacterium]